MNTFEISHLSYLKSEILPPDCSTGKATFGRMVLLLLAALFLSFSALAQSTAFTYQGSLNHAGSPATGLYEITFTLYDSMTNGNVIGTPITLAPVPVTNGLFTASLDFGSSTFTGANRWLEIAVTVFGSDQPVVTLEARQPITAAPYAVRAATASSLVTLTDDPLDIAVNGVRAMRLEPHTNAANVIGGWSKNYVVDGIWGATIAGGGGLDAVFPGSGRLHTNAVVGSLGTIGGGGGNLAGQNSFVGGGVRNLAFNSSVVSGGIVNTNLASYGFVGGGALNSIEGSSGYAVIVGGQGNALGLSAYSSVGGGRSNSIDQSELSTIAGGGFNRIGIRSPHSTISGGVYNQVQSGQNEATVIAGGEKNIVRGGSPKTTISGGSENFIDTASEGASIVGGKGNAMLTNAAWAFIGGGIRNLIGPEDNRFSFSGGSSVIAGGFENALRASGSTIAGGSRNTNDANLSFIGGGSGNVIAPFAYYSSLVGGKSNRIARSATYATVAGGANNAIGTNSPHSSIGGGNNNIIAERVEASVIAGGTSNGLGAHSDDSTIGGGEQNRIATNSWASTVGGGSHNDIGTNSFLSVIAGGSNNNIANNADRGAIAGGEFNNIGSGAGFTFIGGGGANSANSVYCTIGGGTFHYIGTNSGESVIAGGFMNQITNGSTMSTIGGGQLNSIGPNSFYGSIGGGYNNTIAANSGYGTIPGGDRNSATNHAFAAGSLAKAKHTGAFVWGDFSGTEIESTNANSVTMRAAGGYRLFSTSNLTAGVYLAPGSGAWDVISDRNAKESFTPTQPREVLDKVAALPIATWNYKSQDKSIRHIGPTAQDFHAAFNVGENDRTITTIDADGVALAAIQGLNQKLQDELKRRDAENAELKERLAKLEKLFAHFSSSQKE